jgi:hypothetical protein
LRRGWGTTDRQAEVTARAARRLREEAAIISETSHNDAPDLTEAISQLRKVLASELPLELTKEYLIQLQNALEVAERAVRAERWAREGREFQGEFPSQPATARSRGALTRKSVAVELAHPPRSPRPQRRTRQ